MTSYSPLLAITEIAQNQNNKYLTHNNAIKFLEWATQRTLTKTGSYTSNEWLPTETEFTQNFYFKASGMTAATNFVCPAATNVTTLERIFAVENADAEDTLTVKGPSAGTTVALLPGSVAVCKRIGNDIVAVTVYEAAGRAYDVGFFVPGLPAASAAVMILKAVRPWKLLGNAAGSQCKVVTNPTATAVFDIQKNEASVGSISINTSGVATFTTTSGNPVTFVAGDRLMIVAPGTQDTTLANVGVMFFGLRTP